MFPHRISVSDIVLSSSDIMEFDRGEIEITMACKNALFQKKNAFSYATMTGLNSAVLGLNKNAVEGTLRYRAWLPILLACLIIVTNYTSAMTLVVSFCQDYYYMLYGDTCCNWQPPAYYKAATAFLYRADINTPAAFNIWRWQWKQCLAVLGQYWLLRLFTTNAIGHFWQFLLRCNTYTFDIYSMLDMPASLYFSLLLPLHFYIVVFDRLLRRRWWLLIFGTAVQTNLITYSPQMLLHSNYLILN